MMMTTTPTTTAASITVARQNNQLNDYSAFTPESAVSLLVSSQLPLSSPSSPLYIHSHCGAHLHTLVLTLAFTFRFATYILHYKTVAFYTNWIQSWFDCRWVSILTRSNSFHSIECTAFGFSRSERIQNILNFVSQRIGFCDFFCRRRPNTANETSRIGIFDFNMYIACALFSFCQLVKKHFDFSLISGEKIGFAFWISGLVFLLTLSVVDNKKND